MAKKTAREIVRALVVMTTRFPGARIKTSDHEAIIINALDQQLQVFLTDFTVRVVRDPGTALETQIGRLSNRQVRANRIGHWDRWAEVIVAGHCANVPKEKVIQTLTRLKIEAAMAERFGEAFDYQQQIRRLNAKS